ncbi:SOS response-associated peptidase [Antarcticibacterium arcticum]|uniref:Abasic site processing protein n=1 Tax=Antarcticibacterium arcticum TaxID=2585771 RepID=A0A5B8YH99_9FLAO|nr:SOS response-associated peptidase [Antarcticibacterium arcticum]QED37352.1 SOS response-associated peptidase [Antarcticibacterium arcticum]
MCYRTQMNKTISEIEKAFNAKFTEPESYVPLDEINGFTFIKTPVITDESRGEIDLYHWGLIPFWAKEDSIKKNTLNARIETVTDKPAFRNSVENRCLVLANGYYEWQWLDEKGKQKQKFFITPRDQEIFAFAGIYSSWKNPDTGELINSYSIITTEANELMSEIHNNKKRMPVVLRQEDRNHWLSGKDVTNFAFPYEVALQAKAV